MKLLDLCCGVGGAAAGYAQAGFEVTGVDLVRQPEYPFEFHLADALSFPLDGFDVVHASPPCKRDSALNAFGRRHPTLFDPHPEVIALMRARLIEWGGPYVIENVPRAQLIAPVVYCGSSFGLPVRRHRLFESNVALTAPACDHRRQGASVGVYGLGGAQTSVSHGTGGGHRTVTGADAAAALGIGWSTCQRSLTQAIPPAYTAHIGRQLRTYLERLA